MREVPPPPMRDRMMGRYFGQCPSCRTGRLLGPDCGGGGPEPTRSRRKAERAALRRYTATAMAEEAFADDAENDPEPDCRHGRNGLCELYGGDRCTFLCHPPFEETFGDRYMKDTETRLLAEDSIAASFLVGETPEGFYRRLPGACSWVRHLPEGEQVQMARECSFALNGEALRVLLTAWRHRAAAWQDGPELPMPRRWDPRYSIDHEAGAMYVHLMSGTVAETVEVTPWLHVDYGADGVPVGVELLRLDLRDAEAG